VSSRDGNQGIRQDPQKRQRFIDLFYEDRTYGDIGEFFGVSASRVGQIARRLWKDGELTGYPRKPGKRS
jgi:DNA-directed RNA polymerase specialized sigma subunit